MDNLIRILLLDDHALFRESLARLLNLEPDMRVVGHTATIDDALGIVTRLTVDLILLDYDLGSERGTDILQSLSVLKSAPRVLVVTAGMPEKSMQSAVAAGAIGFVAKHSGPQSLLNAIRKAVSANAASENTSIETIKSDRAEQRSSIQDRPLTRRQSTVLNALLDGLSNREIALRLHMSETQVKAAIQELFAKAGVRTRSQLVRVVIEKYRDNWMT